MAVKEEESLFGATAVAVMFVMVLLSVSALGRMFPEKRAPGHRIYTVKNGAETYDVLDKLGVRGRTLVFFGKVLTIGPEPLGLTHDLSRASKNRNPLYLSMRNNFVGRIYRVVPDDRWAKARRNLVTYSSAYYDGKRLNTISYGTPIIVTRFRDMPAAPGKVIVYIESGNIKDYGADRIKRIADDRKYSDIVLVRAGRKSYAF